MQLNHEQQLLVEENMGLVGKVIKDKVHGLGQPGMLSFDDLFQIGCIGLCKAAATDRGTGRFSTYAYRLIWNEICDALIKLNCINQWEESKAPEQITYFRTKEKALSSIEFGNILSRIEAKASPAVRKGITALKLESAGQSSKEIADRFKAEPGTVRMWMTRARRYLKQQTELQGVIQN